MQGPLSLKACNFFFDILVAVSTITAKGPYQKGLEAVSSITWAICFFLHEFVAAVTIIAKAPSQNELETGVFITECQFSFRLKLND